MSHVLTPRASTHAERNAALPEPFRTLLNGVTPHVPQTPEDPEPFDVDAQHDRQATRFEPTPAVTTMTQLASGQPFERPAAVQALATLYAAIPHESRTPAISRAVCVLAGRLDVDVAAVWAAVDTMPACETAGAL